MDDRIVADQWGCDVPVRGSLFQDVHVDYQRPLFPECPDLALPPFAIVVKFCPGPRRRWYSDSSREVEPIPVTVWSALTADQRRLLKFPIRP